jgi:GcrA cell cycle regulator
MAIPFQHGGSDSSSDYPKSSLTFVSEYPKLLTRRATPGKQASTMEATNWAPEHSDALREFLARGMTFSEIAKAINSKFKTAYSRNATLGRAKRMGLGRPVRPESLPEAKPRLSRLGELRPAEPRTSKFHWSPPAFEEAEPLNLRCVEIEPRHLSLIELERRDCRYPYGGDAEGEAITFCGHPRRPGSSYCTPHFHLSRDPAAALERPASTAALKVVEAA